jgi:hypothetical protein
MKTVISNEYIIIDSDQEDTIHSPIESTTEEESQSMESESDEETSCATKEGKIRLFQKYISCKILIQSSKYELLLNFKVLSRFTHLLFFDVNFPQEIITFINTIYIELRRKSIAVDFDLEKLGHLCPCDEHLYCHEQWYDIVNEMVGERIDDMGKQKNHQLPYHNLLECRWDLYQCDVEKQNDDDDEPEICHNFFNYSNGEDSDQNNGFLCRGCGQICCIQCRSSLADFCIECYSPGDYT